MRAPPSAHLHFAFLLLLSLSNLYLPFHIHSKGCSSTTLIHTHLQQTLLSLRPSDPPTPHTYIPAPHPFNKRLRELATRLHTSRICSLHLRRSARQHLEFALVSSPLDSILVYILTVVPPYERVVLEIGGDSLATAPLALFQGFRVVALAETWRTYDSARAFYSRNIHVMRHMPTANALAVEAGRVKGKLRTVLKEVGVSRVDVVVNFAGNGDDLGILEEIDELRARVVVMRYADFVKMARVVVNGGGAGVVVVVEEMKRRGYRLVWCLAMRPVAVFVREDMEVGLDTLGARRCLGERDTGVMWRRDMEVLWDEAWERGWKRVK